MILLSARNSRSSGGILQIRYTYTEVVIMISTEMLWKIAIAVANMVIVS